MSEKPVMNVCLVDIVMTPDDAASFIGEYLKLYTKIRKLYLFKILYKLCKLKQAFT